MHEISVSPQADSIRDARPEVELILGLARVELATPEAERLQALLRRGLDWSCVLPMAHRHGTTALLYRHLNAIGPEDVPADILDQLRRHSHDVALRNLYMAGELVKLLDLLGSHGISAIPYKGPTLAVLAYGNLALREFGDLDLLLPAPDIPRARDLMFSRGYRLGYGLAPDREATYLRVKQELPLVLGDRLLVELHAAVTSRDHRVFWDYGPLRERIEPVPLVGEEVPTFAAEDLLVILCVHGARHCWQSLGWISDLDGLIQRRPRLRWDLVLDRARTLHAKRLLLVGLALTADLLRTPLPERIRSGIEADPIVTRLAFMVIRGLFRGPHEPFEDLEKLYFHLRVRERLRDGALYCLSLALVPRVDDWAIHPLPSRLSALYYIHRPSRLAARYFIRKLRK